MGVLSDLGIRLTYSQRIQKQAKQYHARYAEKAVFDSTLYHVLLARLSEKPHNNTAYPQYKCDQCKSKKYRVTPITHICFLLL
jgi:hypothetical protein